MKYYKQAVLSVIALTTLPFLYLTCQIDFSTYSKYPLIFWSNFWLQIGSMMGLIATILLFWNVLLGIRFLTRFITSDIAWINKVHCYIGKYGIIFALIHPLFTMLAYAENLVWIVLPDTATAFDTSVTWGRISLILMAVVWLTSAIIKGMIKYRPWLYIHYLSYPVLLMAIIHAQDIGTVLAKTQLLMSLWTVLLISTFVVVVLRLALAGGVFSRKYRIMKVSPITSDLFEVSIKPQSKAFSIIQPGQYFYIQLHPFGEAHPFSVMKIDNLSGELHFGVKAVGRYTKDFSKVSPGQTLLLDGPYGVFTQGHKVNRKRVIIAGGIGITPFIPGILANPQDTILFNCNQYMKNVLQRVTLQKALQKNYYDCITREPVSGENIINERITFKRMHELLGAEVINNAEYYICGNKTFIAEIKRSLIQNQVNRKCIHVEMFF